MVKKKGYAMLTIPQIERDIRVHKAHCFMIVQPENEFMGCKYGPDSECPANKLEDLIAGLSLFEKQVLRDLTEIGYDWYQGYSAIDFRGKTKNEVRKAVYKLRLLGLVDYARGLMMEDEYEVAGSGWRVVRKHDVIEYFDNNQTFEEALDNVQLLPDQKEKLKAAHEREMVNRFR